jgi:hypothetical protein
MRPTGTGQIAVVTRAAPGIAHPEQGRLPEAGGTLSAAVLRLQSATGTTLPRDGSAQAATATCSAS